MLADRAFRKYFNREQLFDTSVDHAFAPIGASPIHLGEATAGQALLDQ